MEAAGAAEIVDFAVLKDSVELTVRRDAAEVVEAILRIVGRATIELRMKRVRTALEVLVEGMK